MKYQNPTNQIHGVFTPIFVLFLCSDDNRVKKHWILAFDY